jgi:hypothetical protein
MNGQACIQFRSFRRLAHQYRQKIVDIGLLKTPPIYHSRKTGIQKLQIKYWIPASAGMTKRTAPKSRYVRDSGRSPAPHGVQGEVPEEA